MDKETNEIIKEIFGIYEGMALDSNVIALIKVLKKWYFEKEEYKSRIDKAIEYIHNNQLVFELSSKKQIQEWFEKEYYVELLKILRGDKE